MPLYSPWIMGIYTIVQYMSHGVYTIVQYTGHGADIPLYNPWVMECIYHLNHCTAHGPWIHHCTIHDLWGGGTIVQPMAYGQPIPHGLQVVQQSDFHRSWAVQHRCTVNV